MIPVQTTVTGFAFRCHLAFGDVHDLPAVVLALVREYDNGKCLTGLGERDFHTELESALTEQRDPSVRRSGGTGVNSGHHCMSGQRGFHGGVGFGVSDLANDDHIGVKPQRRHHKIFLRNVVRFILARSGQRVHHIVQRVTESVLLHEEQLTGAGLNGVDPLVIGDTRQERVHQCGLAGTGSTGNDDRYSIPDTHFEECDHFLGRHSALNDVLPVNSLRMQKTDRNRNPRFLVHNRAFDRRDAGIVREMSLCNRRGAVNDHSAVMQQPFDDVNGVLGAAKMLGELFRSAVRIGQRDVIPGVDIDLVNVGRTEKRCEDRILHHFGIQTVDELLISKARNKKPAVKDILFDIGFELVVLLLVGERRRVIPCDMLLCFGEQVIQFNPYHTPPPDRQSLSFGFQSVYPRSSRRACLSASAP